MNSRKTMRPVVRIGTAALLLALFAFAAGCGKDTVSDGAPQTGAGGGEAAKTVAPVEQRYPDGTVVPYNTAPAGSTPGNPASIKR